LSPGLVLRLFDTPFSKYSLDFLPSFGSRPSLPLFFGLLICFKEVIGDLEWIDYFDLGDLTRRESTG